MVNAIAAADQEQQGEFIRAGMDEDAEALRSAPPAVGEFFDRISAPPEWFDPETQMGDANFLDHPHRGITTGQTGIIGSGCYIYPCTLGGLSGKVQQRHPIIGDYVFVGTDAGIFGPVQVGDRTAIGANTEINGIVAICSDCRIGVSVSIGTIIAGPVRPGAIKLGAGVRVGAGTVIENDSPLELVIPDQVAIPVRSHVVNDGCGGPKFV